MYVKAFTLHLTSEEDSFFSSAETTLVERPLINGDHVLSVNMLNQGPVFHRERLRSAGEMLNSSSLQPRVRQAS